MKSVLIILLVMVSTSLSAQTVSPEARHAELLKSSISFATEAGFKYRGSTETVTTEGFRGDEKSFTFVKRIKDSYLLGRLGKLGHGNGSLVLTTSRKQIRKRDLNVLTDSAARMIGAESREARKELERQAAAVLKSIQKDKSDKKKHESGWFSLPGDTNGRYLFLMAEDPEKATSVLGIGWNVPLRAMIDSNPAPTTIEWKTGKRLLNLVAWNVESGGNDPAVIAKQMNDFSGADVIALNEVGRRNVPLYAASLGNNYKAFVSETGRADHLAILFDAKRFELLEHKEMHHYREHYLNNGTHRSPLYVRLKERKTKFEFIFMTNHLARRDEDLRQRQAAGLREWARDNNTPIIAMGDFNFDYSFKKKSGNESFNVFMRDGVWKWIKPSPLIDTNWSGGIKDNYPDSMLDFVFVANSAKEFDAHCEIVVREGDFPDDETTSDHRPTIAEITF